MSFFAGPISFAFFSWLSSFLFNKKQNICCHAILSTKVDSLAVRYVFLTCSNFICSTAPSPIDFLLSSVAAIAAKVKQCLFTLTLISLYCALSAIHLSFKSISIFMLLQADITQHSPQYQQCQLIFSSLFLFSNSITFLTSIMKYISGRLDNQSYLSFNLKPYYKKSGYKLVCH